MMGEPHLEVPGTIFIVLGVAFIAFRGKIAAWFSALSERMWRSQGAKRPTGIIGPSTMEPAMAVALGIAWILSGIMMLFVV